MNKRLTDFYLPRVIHPYVNDEQFLMTAHIMNINGKTESQQYEAMAVTMKANQQAVFQVIMAAIDRSPTTAHFFLEGAGGIGKTYLYWAVYSYYCSRVYRDKDNNGVQQFVFCVASTGIAGLLLPGGQTAHPSFAVPHDTSFGSKLRPSDERARLLWETQLIIWDEVLMQKREVVEAVDKCLREITKVDSLFGGIPVVLGGNWAQSLLVVPQGSHGDIVNACLQRPSVWPCLQQIFLQ